MDKSQPTAAPQPDAAAAKNIESFYPLSPMQQGMLFHSLFAPESGVYVEQLNTTLRGRLDIPAFERTWQRVVQRHPILRTAFAWEGLKEPIQVVRREVTMAIAQEDWRGLDPAEQQRRLAVFLQTEQAQGFDLTKAPLIRLALLRLADDAYEFIWTHHHILLDGWSIPLLLREVFAHYDAFSRGQDLHLPAPRPFRDYIVWLRRQDIAQAEAYWRRTLKGFTAPTPLTVGTSAPDAGEAVAHGELEAHLPADLTEKLTALARQHRLTLNTLVMGAWALLLSRYSREEDVLFGATVSGRPADLPGAESMMGLFINTLPVRVHVPPAAELLTWLRELQARQAELRQYEYTPLVEIQGWSEVPRSLPLFESILVFENLPLGPVTAGGAGGGTLEVADVRSASHTNYPVTVVAVPDREMLLREVFAHYDAFSRGQDLHLPAPRPFRDYIVWLRRQDMAQAEAYWRRTLKGFTAPTPMTVGTSAPDAGEAVAHGELEAHLPADLTEKLTALARQYRLTLNTLVMGAWALLLSRYSREEDVLFGATVSGRPADLPGAESMMGLFINTLPVRVHVPPAAELLTWLRELQARQAELRQYEYTPLVEIQGWSEVPRSLPLFESILVFENLPLGPVTAGGAGGGTLEVADVRSASHTNYPVTVVAVPDREMLLRLSYDNARFDPATIERMMGHLRTLLAGFVEDPNRQLRQFPLLTAAERHALLTRWHATARQFPADATIHGLFEAQAAATPDAIALNLPPVEAYTSAPGAPPPAPAGVALTYGELNARANQLAHHLRGRGVGPNVLVAMYVDRSIEMVVGILGILKAGGAYVPIDPVYPAERIQHILADSGAQILVTLDHLTADGRWQVAGDRWQGDLVRLDTDWPVIARQPTTNVPPSTFNIQHSLAYVIYTSGSTGVPKGCGITHANVVRLFRATEHWYGFDAADVWTLFHSYAFDFTVWELWGALFYGGRLVVIPHAITRSPEAFYRLLCAERVTVLNQTPSAFRQLIRAEEAVGVCPDLALRYVIFGGEALELQSLRPWYARHGDARPRLINMYGITETTVHVTYRPLSLVDVEAGKGSVIGVPIPDLQLYIVDANLEPVPIGVPGELVVGGAGVAPGYLNRPELTAERFVRNPFDRDEGRPTKDEGRAAANEKTPSSSVHRPPSARLYRSGDLARYLPDGDIEYLGRIDHQVKIRGFRVELGEIETLLAQHPGIREAIVLAREDTPGHKRLVAYCVSDRAAIPALGELRDFLAAKLPDYMVPAAFVMLDALPLTAHGKVDRKALPAPDEGRLAVETAYVAPRNETEAQLAAIWAQVLGVPRVGIRDSYFELGGESILSLQIIARAKKAGIEFSPRQLFEHPTIEALLAALQGAREVVAEQGVVTGPAPLTPVQQWFFEHHPAHPEHFNTSMLLLTWPEVDVAALRGAVAALLTHHDALRMAFVQMDAGWQQTNAGLPVDVPFDSVDLSGLEPDAQEAALAAQTAALQAGFRLDGADLLVRAAHFNLGAGRPGRLLLAFHHLVADGVSWRIVLEDLTTAYRMLRRGGTPGSLALPPKTTAYRDWAARLAEYAGSPALLAEAPYWRALAAQPVATLPVDHPGGRNTYGATDDITLSLSAAETQALLQETPAAYGTQINDLLLTALARTFAAWTSSPRLLVEMEGHGREDLFPDMDVSRTIGWFTSIFPVLLDLGDPAGGSPGTEHRADLGDQIRAVKDQLRRVPNRGVGYGILRYLSPDPALRAALAVAPAPQVNFNYLGQFNPLISEADDAAESAVETPDPEAWAILGVAPEAPGPEQAPDAPRSALLYVVCVVTDGGMDVRWLYSPELFERNNIERLAEAYLREVRSIIAHCQALLSGGIRG